MMTRDGAILAGVGLAALLGLAWLIGVHQQDAMLEAGHARAAFAAVKAAAGPRMQVRKITISRSEMSVLAYDPDMPQTRYVPGNRSHYGHWVEVNGVYEQSWRVSYTTVFGHDWYRVTGPTSEGIIQQNAGTPFDLRPDDIIEVADLLRRATPDPATPKEACPLRLIEEGRVWSICEHQGEVLLVFLRAVFPASKPAMICDAPRLPDADHPLESLVPLCHPAK